MKAKTFFSSESARRLLEENGLADIDSLFRRGEVVHLGRHSYKEVVRLDVRSERSTEPVFVKRQWRGTRVFPRLSDLRMGELSRMDPVREWIGLTTARVLGLNTAEPLALFSRPLERRAAVVMRGVPGDRSISELIDNGELERMSSDEMEALADAVLATVRRLYEVGYAWRSLAPKHMYPEATPHGTFRVWLIDCEGLVKVKRRDRLREWHVFLSALRDEGAPPEFVGRLERGVTGRSRRIAVLPFRATDAPNLAVDRP